MIDNNRLEEIENIYPEKAKQIELNPKYEAIRNIYESLFIDNFYFDMTAIDTNVKDYIDKNHPKPPVDVSKLSIDPLYYVKRAKIYTDHIDECFESCYRKMIQKKLKPFIDEDERNERYGRIRLGWCKKLDIDLVNEMIEGYFNQFCELSKECMIEYNKAFGYKVISKEEENKELAEAISKWADEWNSMTPFERMMNNFLNRETAPTLKEGYVVLFFCLAIEFIFNHFYSWWIITIIIFLCWRKKEIDKYHGRGNKKDLWKW